MNQAHVNRFQYEVRIPRDHTMRDSFLSFNRFKKWCLERLNDSLWLDCWYVITLTVYIFIAHSILLFEQTSHFQANYVHFSTSPLIAKGCSSEMRSPYLSLDWPIPWAPEPASRMSQLECIIVTSNPQCLQLHMASSSQNHSTCILHFQLVPVSSQVIPGVNSRITFYSSSFTSSLLQVLKSSWWEPSSWLHMAIFLLCPYMVKRGHSELLFSLS